MPHWVTRGVADLWTWAQAGLFPPTCILCGGAGQPPLLDICAPCAADLPCNEQPCPRCAEPRPSGQEAQGECERCRRQPPPFDAACAPFRYDYPLDQILQSFKYRGRLAHGRVLGTLLAHHLHQRGGILPQVLLPMPLHPQRHRERGFNQSYELARALSRCLQVPLSVDLAWRHKRTEDQVSLSFAQRQTNVRGAFSVRAGDRFAHVAIIDDVLTTGSTAAELARTLKAGGVGCVEVWTVARALDRQGWPSNR